MRVLVVAAHPDDEVLGCGATMAKHAAAGDAVHVLILAEGATSRDAARDLGARSDELARLRASARAAAQLVGAAPPRFSGLPDNRMDEIALLDVVKHVELAVDDVGPDVVYTHHGGDLNIDHRITHQAVVTACRGLEGATVRAIHAFEVPSSTEWSAPSVAPPFSPSHFVDVTDFLEAKLHALTAYAAEMRPFPHPRSYEYVEHLARVRGAAVGVLAAEAFAPVRTIA